MLERALKYLVRELVSGPGSPGGQVAHVLEDRVVAHARLLRQLILQYYSINPNNMYTTTIFVYLFYIFYAFISH